jgi:hypothetical protein
MRRLLIVLLSIFMTTALMPSTALAKLKPLPPQPEFTSVEWTASGAGTAPGTCATSVKAEYANAPGGSTLKFFLYDGGLGSLQEVATVKPNNKGVTTITFDRAYTFNQLYIVRVVMGKKAETFAYKSTSIYQWVSGGWCPSSGLLLASWPAP